MQSVTRYAQQQQQQAQQAPPPPPPGGIEDDDDGDFDFGQARPTQPSLLTLTPTPTHPCP